MIGTTHYCYRVKLASKGVHHQDDRQGGGSGDHAIARDKPASADLQDGWGCGGGAHATARTAGAAALVRVASRSNGKGVLPAIVMAAESAVTDK